MRISIRLSIGLLASVALLIGACTRPDAMMDNGKMKKKKRVAVVIEVTVPDEQCRYQIRTVEGDTLSDAEQDTFYMWAGGFLNVMATGTAAQFRIEDDPKKGKGYKKKGTANVEDGEEDVLSLRAPRKNDLGSYHEVKIRCCDDFNGDGDACTNPVESDDLSSAESEGDRANRASVIPVGGLLDLSLDDDEPGSGPPKPGGPGMDVHP